MAAVRAAFKPEFINRLDDVILFDHLDPEELVSIVDIQLAQLQKRLAQRRLTLEVSLQAKQWLAEHGFDPVSDEARREARRVIDTYAPFVARGVPVVGLEPSCLLAFRDELPSLLPGEPADRLAAHALLIEEFIAREAEAGRLALPLAPISAPATRSEAVASESP